MENINHYFCCVDNERFTDIQQSIPGTTLKVLAKELKELEQHKLVKRIITEDYLQANSLRR